ncbi:GerAB/ArcD/ProY family transporter [Pseudoneobacillus sp. C159]
MSISVPENAKVSHFFVFFLISSMQIGIGVLGFQRIIAKSAGYDAWISVIIAGLTVHIILSMMYKIVETVDGDLISAHTFILGKKIGNFISFLFLFYFLILAMTVVRTFIEIIQVWMFPEFKTFWFSLGFLLLIIYIIYGGFRAVTGIAFFSSILPSYLVFMFAFNLPYSNFENLLPILNHKLTDILNATKDMSLTYLGYETLLFYYPYIKNPEKSKRFAHLALLSTMILYTIVTLITFAYFSEKQLEQTVWATLTMWKIVHMPFVERFEYIGIANWCLIILPNLCLSIWCASRILKRTVNLRKKKGVILIAFLCLICINFFETRIEVNLLNDIASRMGLYFHFLYIPILFIAVLVTKKVKKT